MANELDWVNCPGCGKVEPSESTVLFAKGSYGYRFVAEWTCPECGFTRRQAITESYMYNREQEKWYIW